MSRIRKRNPVFGIAGLAVAFLLLLPLLPSKAFNSRVDEEGVRAHFHWHQHREASWLPSSSDSSSFADTRSSTLSTRAPSSSADSLTDPDSMTDSHNQVHLDKLTDPAIGTDSVSPTNTPADYDDDDDDDFDDDDALLAANPASAFDDDFGYTSFQSRLAYSQSAEFKSRPDMLFLSSRDEYSSSSSSSPRSSFSSSPHSSSSLRSSSSLSNPSQSSSRFASPLRNPSRSSPASFRNKSPPRSWKLPRSRNPSRISTRIGTQRAWAPVAPTPEYVHPSEVSLNAALAFERQRVLRQEQRRRQQQVTGPCSPLETAKVIRIKSYADVAKRLDFAPTQTVMLVLLPPGFIASTGLLFDGNYSCTILRSKKPAQRSYIKLTNALQPVLRIWNTHNVIVMDVNFYLPVKSSSRLCSFTEVGKGMLCPAIHIWRSYGVQVAKGEVFGRIDVFRSMQARVDGMSVTATYRFVNSPGVIRIGESGYGPELVRSNIVISNNEAYGVDTPIVMHWGAVGVTVINNFVHDFGFAGIRCGADVHFAGDCMLSNISNNIVYNWRRNSSGDVDSAGIYYCTHWFSPGNVAECNYVAGGDHCYYLDYVTSGVVIRGGACINTYDGIKVNNGKLNVIKHVILKNVEGMPGWCTCFTPTVNNCRKDPGTYWEAMRLKYYDTDLFRRLWPWWPSVCKDTSINGVSCNPPGSMAAYLTGNCSGLGTENYLDLVVVNMTKRSLDYKYCEKIPVMPKFNTHKMINITTSSLKVLRKMGFRNYKRHDLAIESWSPIYKWRPQFKSCRKGLAGMKVITREEYKKAFNIPKPEYFDFTLAMNLTHIHDRTLF